MNLKIYTNRDRITCQACKLENQPVDLWHVPSICVACAQRLRAIDARASNIYNIRSDMRAVGIPVGGASQPDGASAAISRGSLAGDWDAL
jgi:hypothetical protein